MFGIGVLNYKIWTENTVKGVSIKTFSLYAAVFFFRLCSILRHQGYLPFDKVCLCALWRPSNAPPTPSNTYFTSHPLTSPHIPSHPLPVCCVLLCFSRATGCTT